MNNDKITTLESGESEIAFIDKYSNRESIVVNHLIQANWRARLASILIEKWGMVLCVPDGEDSSGRAKMRLSTPEEVVSRACESADKAVDAFYLRGWVDKVPSLKELEE